MEGAVIFNCSFQGQRLTLIKNIKRKEIKTMLSETEKKYNRISARIN